MSSLRLLSVLAALAAVSPDTAHAADPACGVYRDADSGARLEVTDARNARLLRDGLPPSRRWYVVAGKRVLFHDRDEGYVDELELSADGRTLRGVVDEELGTYVREREADCAPSPAPAPGSCEADPAPCFARLFSMDAPLDQDTLRRFCSEGLSAACVLWIEGLRPEPELPASLAEEPPVCREGTPAFDEKACREAVDRALGATLGELLHAVFAEDAPIPPAGLDALPALCREDPSATTCGKVAEELWSAGRLAEAREALQTACTRGEDADACSRLAPLRSVAVETLRTTPATALPCGRFFAATGLMRELDFGDRGLVTGLGGVQRARLDDGRVRLRHDKDGDFVFVALDDGRLIGIDEWNRYAVYDREGGPRSCAAPIAFEETPLVEDCPQPGPETPATCCTRGSAQGCNILGHQAVLAEDWAGARANYEKVCAVGIRVGCENLARVFARNGDESVPETLDRLCAAQPRHVACDVRETTDWAAYTLSSALQDLLQEMNNEEAKPEKD